MNELDNVPVEISTKELEFCGHPHESSERSTFVKSICSQSEPLIKQ